MNAYLKKGLAITLLIGAICMFSSCSSPESIAKKDAKEMAKAMNKQNARAMEKAMKQQEKHLSRYREDRDKYFRYSDAYKEEIQKHNY